MTKAPLPFHDKQFWAKTQTTVWKTQQAIPFDHEDAPDKAPDVTTGVGGFHYWPTFVFLLRQ